MIDTTQTRKNKINLSDYDYEKDIKNRLIMSNFSQTDVEVMEEILFSSLKFPKKRLVDNLELEEAAVDKSLRKLSETGLFEIDGETIVVDKESRKYFEFQLEKFEEDFRPGMEFLQSLLKKVPIQVLPTWYPIPRTSNNIFDSLVEKYLHTPQTYQRYLTELEGTDEELSALALAVLHAPKHEISAEALRDQFEMTQEKFEETILHLEFNFLCCLTYKKIGDEWKEYVTLFSEWKDHLEFLKTSQPKALEDQEGVAQHRPRPFSFVEDLTALVNLASKTALPLKLQDECWIPDASSMKNVSEALGGFDLSTEVGMKFFLDYTSRLLHKTLFFKFTQITGSKLHVVANNVDEWLTLPIEKRALAVYKHSAHYENHPEYPSEICTERNIREIEKSINRALHGDWVLLDDYLQSMLAPLSDQSKITLTKHGRNWCYSKPQYSTQEMALMRKITYECLFEGGIISTGTLDGNPAFRVTPFGKSLFG